MEAIKIALPRLTLNQAEFHALVLRLLDEVGNLRSSVSRIAISALTNLCKASKKLLDPEIDIVDNSFPEKGRRW